MSDTSYNPARSVTVDTCGRDDVFPGACLVWLHVPSSGYGYAMPVPARVMAHSRSPRTSVKIEVTAKNGRKVTRTVDVQNLRWSR